MRPDFPNLFGGVRFPLNKSDTIKLGAHLFCGSNNRFRASGGIGDRRGQQRHRKIFAAQRGNVARQIVCHFFRFDLTFRPNRNIDTIQAGFGGNRRRVVEIQAEDLISLGENHDWWIQCGLASATRGRNRRGKNQRSGNTRRGSGEELPARNQWAAHAGNLIVRQRASNSRLRDCGIAGCDDTSASIFECISVPDTGLEV